MGYSGGAKGQYVGCGRAGKDAHPQEGLIHTLVSIQGGTMTATNNHMPPATIALSAVQRVPVSVLAMPYIA